MIVDCEGYKEIIVPLEGIRESDVFSVLDEVNLCSDKTGISADLIDGQVVFSFNSVDYHSLVSEWSKVPDNGIIAQFKCELDSIKSYGLSGGKRQYIGYNTERKVRQRKEKEKKRLGFSSFSKSFSDKNNELSSDKYNLIVSGDSETALKQYPDNCIDIIFTSPPYNFGLAYETFDDTYDWNAYYNKLFAVFTECIRVLKYGGRIIVNVQPLFSDYIPSHHLISNFFFNQGLIWKGEILWEKNNYNCKYTAWGSWKSPSNPYLKYTWEFLEIFCKGALKKEGSSENADITPDEFKKWVNAKWSIAPERDMSKYGHPAMFPEELVKRVLRLFSFKNDIVLDPFNGAGTTTFVAKEYHRRYIGIDISEEYCKTAKERLSQLDERLFI